MQIILVYILLATVRNKCCSYEIWQMQIILVYIFLATVRKKCCSYEFIQYKVCRLSEPLARNPLLGSRGLGSITPKGSVQGTAEHPASSKACSPVEMLHPEVCSAFLLHINTTISAWRSNQPQCFVPGEKRES